MLRVDGRRAALGESRRQIDRDFNSTISRLIEDSDIEEVKRASLETDVEKAVLEQVKQVSMVIVLCVSFCVCLES